MKVNLIKQSLPPETDNKQTKPESHPVIGIPFVHSRSMYTLILLLHIFVIWFALQLDPVHPSEVTYAMITLHFITIVMGIWISIQPYEHRRQVLSLLFHAYYGFLTSVDLLFISGKLIHIFFHVTEWWMYALLGVIYIGAGLEIATAGKWRLILSAQQCEYSYKKVTAEEARKREKHLTNAALIILFPLAFLFVLPSATTRQIGMVVLLFVTALLFLLFVRQLSLYKMARKHPAWIMYQIQRKQRRKSVGG
ncbi:hypothetical protein [Brevibacillus laterosporus]|uniref:hypothetical protein n=1 Tax=Brevibacillus laterosporus TaxID=1465 RepID=UPI002655EB47|nr:hypothetical protein [Brevibacillus laterosporus]MDN9009787.1 hypothetical protein [Brevibacillus laterosporus]MDO0940831.1 hypothetical protein [Brevibacillus laterosporus]